MCKPDYTTVKTSKPALQEPSGLLSFETKPSVGPMALGAAGIVSILFAVEHALRFLFEAYKHSHPILENETNRLILARHIGTDFLCCAAVGTMGLTAFQAVCPGFIQAALRKPGAMPKGGFEARMFMYHPAAFRICLFFASYQIKNLFDTIVWNDGPEFIAHHVMCMFVAYGSVFHGVGHHYAPFFFGVSELSTAVLCLLANFDDTHGVPGLADAFPTAKVVFGALFAVAFFVCRVFLWMFAGYYFVTDALLAINKTDSTRDVARPWVKIFLGSFTGLSALQVIWLGQIIMVAMEEYQKMTA